MNEPRRRRRIVALCLLLGLSAPALAQLPPRLTAGGVADQLDAARQRLVGQPGTAAIARQLQLIGQALRGRLADRLAQPVTALADRDRGLVLRANAAVHLADDFADAAAGCREGERAAMARALELSVRHLAQSPAAAEPMQAVIDRVEGKDHRAMFALRSGTGPAQLALAGSELSDPQCADPQLSATDAGGALLSAQPRITGVLPTRIELAWDTGGLAPGTYLLHVRPQRKAFLVGCTAQPEAAVALQLVPKATFVVGYVLDAVCGHGGPRTVALGRGTMPPLDGYGATVAQAIDTAACTDPVAYRISATVGYADGASATSGPFEQSADADLTVGLPGGLSMSWEPAVRQLFVRSGAPMCRGLR